MNTTTIKRLLSCFSVLAVCLLSQLGVEAKTVTAQKVVNLAKPATQTISQDANRPLILHARAEAKANEDTVANHYSHYSHSSHVSHQSHYSSRF